MPLILGANSVSGYTVKNSLRVEGASSDSLNINFATSGNRKTFTLSFWYKKVKNGTNQSLFRGDTAQTTNYNHDSIYINSADNIYFGGYTSNFIVTTAVFRDLSAWYHIVLAVDTTQATTSNRIKLYVNSIEQARTEQGGYPAQNTDLAFTKSGNHAWFGSDPFSGLGYGYLAEAYLIDGQALTPSSFGETDTLSGIWIPKAYSGSYGTNGFFLKFLNSASLGTDSSGNGNTFTVNNLTSVDQSTDTPTNNFATWNPLWFTGTTAPNTSFTEGNLTVQTATTGSGSEIQGTMGVNKGKWYYEFKMTSTGTGSGLAVGFANNNYTDSLTYYSDNGKYYTESTSVTYGATWTTNDIIGVAFDCDNNTMIFYKNGVSQGTITTAFSNLSTDYYLPLMWDGSGSLYANGSVNFGNPPYSANAYQDGAGYGNFSYAVPSGYYALNTRNLANFG